MNIAIFASAFYPHVGGVEELVRQLAHDYRRRGLETIVITNRWPRSLPAYEDYEGIPTYRLALRVPDQSARSKVSYVLTHRAVESEMLGILKKHRIDMLHVQCISVNGHYALLARRALKLPLVVTTQGERTMDAAQIYQTNAFLNRTLRSLLQDADAFTACSRNTLDDMEEYWGKSLGERASVVYNGIQFSDFENAMPFSHPKPYILGIGRMVPQKGFDVLIRAFAKADAQSHDLLLAGEGSERENLENLARECKLEDRVKFVGRADRPTAVSLFQGCSFFVLPSRQEPFGIVNLEAMAAGKAVVASRVGGVPEIVFDDENGVLFEGEDVEALAAALTRLASDETLRFRLGENGRRRAARFSWPAIAEQYLNIYNEVQASTQRHDAVT